MNDLQKLLLEFPDELWNYYWLSHNPNITFDHIKENPDKPWDYHRLSENLFKKHPVLVEKTDPNKYL
jgi:hypothetical protein